MHETTKVLLEAVIDNFRLSDGLWVVCGTELQFGARHLEEFLPELANENWISVTNDELGHPVELDNSYTNLSATVLAVNGWETS